MMLSHLQKFQFQFSNLQNIFYQIQIAIQNQCYKCQSQCLQCQIQSTNLNCINFNSKIIIKPNFGELQICYAPYFINFDQKCVICEIKYCLYCFNYLASDPTKTSFSYEYNYSYIDEEIKIGCAQCEEGFLFEFKTEKCIYQQPSQENCLRSYLNFQNEEICTLSAIDDFTIAFEIVNCQNHILNCKNCIRTYQSTLKCLLCEDGYMTSSVTGVCQLCTIINSKQCFENNNQEPWKWLAQGFITKFLPNQTFVNRSVFKARPVVTECKQGYEKFKNQCLIYCNEMCSICEVANNQFFCSKCKLSYYKEPIRSQTNGECIQCSLLCQVCENRSNEDINKINPYFSITPESLIYTQRCIKQIPQKQVQNDANLNIAQYCYQNNCRYNLEYLYVFEKPLDQESYCNSLSTQMNYNFQYLNEIGIQQITQIFQIAENQLIQTKNLFYLIIKIEDLGHAQSIIDFQILDTKFYSIINYPASISIQAESFLNFNLQNLEIFDLNILNSVFFNITCSDQGNDIIISDFKLQNCIFTNSTLFQFDNARRNIIIRNITIYSCQFYNSSITNLINQNANSKLIFNEILIKDSLFHNSNFLYSIDKTSISINHIQIIQNQMMNSKFIIFNYNFSCYQILMKKNQFVSFQLISQISSILLNYEIEIIYLEIYENTIKDFSIFITEQKKSSSQVSFLFQNLYFDENIISCYQEQYLIEVNCFYFTMQDIFLKATRNYRFISLLAIPYIRIENIIYENLKQKQKVGLSSECYQNCISRSQLLQVSGFQNITLQQIQILNQFSIDQSIISIQSNPLFLLTSNEYIIIKDMIVKGNILVKQLLGIIFSFLELYSEKPQIIEIENLYFHENIFHQYQKDPSETYASLLYADSGQSLMKLNNITCTSNSLTNSSSSYIFIFSNELQVENFQVQNHNDIGKEFWIKYYEIEIQGEYNKDEIFYIISKTFIFENAGGVLSSIVTTFTFHNSAFSFLYTQSSQIFTLENQNIINSKY